MNIYKLNIIIERVDTFADKDKDKVEDKVEDMVEEADNIVPGSSVAADMD
jgi:hypothetical protein